MQFPRGKLYQLLGRSGDICTLLPALKHEFDRTGLKPKLIVAQEYAALLDGVTYVEPVIWSGGFERVHEARAFGQRLHRDCGYIDCTVYGLGFHRPPEMSSFDRELWHRSQCPVAPGRLPLIFDRRDPNREKALLEKVVPNPEKPFVLTAFAGTSSPFAHYAVLEEALRRHAPDDTQIVDISHVRAERPYDLLGLYDRAAGLVAIDSFPLHLAAASSVRTLALITDGPTPWHSSSWKPHHSLRCKYSRVPARADQLAKQFFEPFSGLPVLRLITSSSPTPDAGTARRLDRAHKNRLMEQNTGGLWALVPEEATVTRDARSVGEKAPLPFVRDMIQEALSDLDDDHDIVVLVNADIGFTAGITGQILDACAESGACFAHRWDFHKVTRDVTQVTEAQVGKGRWYAGSDLFAFTKQWWLANGSLFPDMLLGRQAWDMVMRNLIKRSGGKEIHQAIWHEKHASPWEQTPTLPGNVHNMKLANQWLSTHGGNYNDWQTKPIYK